MLRLDGTVYLPQFPQANDQPCLGLDMQKQFDGMKPGAVLVNNDLFLAIVIPPPQKTLHGGSKMGIAALESIVELGQEEGVVADHAAYTQQGVAQWRAVSFALNFGMLGKQLT